MIEFCTDVVGPSQHWLVSVSWARSNERFSVVRMAVRGRIETYERRAELGQYLPVGSDTQ